MYSGRVITISREFCSKGGEVGRILGEELNIPVYDKLITEHAAAEHGFSMEYVKELEEKPAKSSRYSLAMHSYVKAGPESMMEPEKAIFETQQRFIEEKAAEGPCVIIGRCANYILRRRPKTLSVFIYADVGSRIRTAMERYELSERDAIKAVRDADRARAAFYNIHTAKEWGEWGDRRNYDIMVNTSLIEEAGAVALLKYYYLYRDQLHIEV